MTSQYGAVRCSALSKSSSLFTSDSRLQYRFTNRRNRCGDLRTKVVQNTAIQEQASSQFDWFRSWWPVQLTSNFHLDRPNPFELLDQNFIAWNGANGDWIVMEDQCPHRMSPLSQGRVDLDGTLRCGHHSWRFNKDGHRVGGTPHAESCEQDYRSSIRVFPCRVHSNMLWVWPEASDDAFRNSSETPIPVPTECDEYLTRKLASGVHVGFTRVMPYSLEILIENLIDPAHVPVTHHGLIPGMIRTEAKPLWMKSCPAMFPYSIVSVKYKGNRDDSERFTELLSPCSIINGTIEEGINSWKGQLMLGSPIRSGKCRLFFFNFPGGVEETEKGFVFKIFGFVQRYLPWLMHLGNHSFVDGDAVFLHRLEVNLRNQESPWNALNYYYVPTSADLMIRGFRNWLKKSAGDGPGLEKGLRNGQLSEASRRELLDRYYTHTMECRDCLNGRKWIQRIIQTCGFLAGMCLVYLGIVLSKISAVRFDLKIAGCVMMLCWCLYVRSYLQRNVIPQFEFVDYVHPEKN